MTAHDAAERPLRVCLIAFDGGEYTMRLAGALAEEVELCLMLPRDLAEANRRWLSPRVNFQPFHKPRLRQPWRQLRLMRRLVARIRAFDPDVIHFQKAHLWFNLVIPLLRRYPLVISVHDPRDHAGDVPSRRTPQWVKDFGYRRATRLIAHSRPMVPLVSSRLGVEADRIDVVPLLPMGDEGAAAEVEEIPGRILFFGRIWGYKGLSYLIQAAPLIEAQVPDLRIVIAGRGDDLAPYRQQMHDPTCFEIHNEFVAPDKQARLFREASLIVLPYTEATQSGVIPVAYNFSRPVVATAVGGLVDQVEEGRTGYLVPPRNVAALAERIVRLLTDPEQRRRMGEEGRRKAQREWSPAVVAGQTIATYDRAIRSRRESRLRPRRRA